MNKAKLTKQQIEDLNYLKNEIWSEERIVEFHAKNNKGWSNDYNSLNSVSLDEMIKALYVGYDLIQTPEEKLKECYEQVLDWSMKPYPIENFEPVFFRAGIMTALKIMEMKVEGITD